MPIIFPPAIMLVMLAFALLLIAFAVWRLIATR